MRAKLGAAMKTSPGRHALGLVHVGSGLAKTSGSGAEPSIDSCHHFLSGWAGVPYSDPQFFAKTAPSPRPLAFSTPAPLTYGNTADTSMLPQLSFAQPRTAPALTDAQRAFATNVEMDAVADRQPSLLGFMAVAGATTLASFVPGVGEALDIATLVSPKSTSGQRSVALASLALNIVTGGTAPNAGGAAGRIHGNALTSPRMAFLYRLEDLEGNLLKWGVT
ncbi:MAG: hypothetical protein K1X74_15260 [Pirellulales bacterium]|nr:hypothetical protein [Pirellulales bacterium]